MIPLLLIIVIITVLVIVIIRLSKKHGSIVPIITGSVIGFILTLVGIIMSRGEIVDISSSGFDRANDVLKNILIFIGITLMVLGVIFGILRYIKSKK
jgi:hypothetical protein